MKHEAHVDYLTVTTGKESSYDSVVQVQVLADSLISLQSERHEIKRYASHGYSGFTSGAVTWGSRSEGILLRVSGELADVASRGLPEDGFNVSRIDLCCTVWLDKHGYTVRGSVEEVARATAAAGRAPRKRKVALVDSGDGAQTLNIGSRVSSQYGRVYNKHAETGDDFYEGAWRFEVEYKNPLSLTMYSNLERGDGRYNQIAATVGQWFRARGVNVPGTPFDGGVVPVVVSERDKTAVRRLEWLRRQVSPVIASLILSEGRDVVYSALGLPLDDD